jgi:hypothetical protein
MKLILDACKLGQVMDSQILKSPHLTLLNRARLNRKED